MPKYVSDNAASVRGVALMVTRLAADGTPATGGVCDNYITQGFISFQFTPEYSEGDEIEIKNAAGEICVTYKLPDTLKNVGIQLEICDPDPILTEMLVGGDLLTATSTDDCAPTGMAVDDTLVVGYAAEETGKEGNPNGVALRVWASAILNGKSAPNCPFWDYLFPSVKFRLDGDRVVENGNLATVFAGVGTGNSGYGSGPSLDFTDVPSPPPAGSFEWKFPTYTDRAYAYARTSEAPTGIKGCFSNTGVAAAFIHAGAPATTTPANATPVRDLVTLNSLGSKGNTVAWQPGQYYVLADQTRAYWDGTAWVQGIAPAVLASLTAGKPGSPSPTNAAMPATLAGLVAIVPPVAANPTSPWQPDEYVQLAVDNVTWNGSTWAIYTGPIKTNVMPGDTFGPEPTVTAEDQANADKLNQLGYFAADAETPWASGGSFAVGSYNFYWDGTIWGPGSAP